MNYLAILAVVALLGSGGSVAGAVYVGAVDWDAIFSDESHHIDYKTTPLGYSFSVINVDPTLASDGQYYSVTKCEFYDVEGPLVLIRGNVEKVDGGIIFSLRDDASSGIFVTGAHIERFGDEEYYVISDTSKIEIQHVERTEQECIDVIYSAERFFNASAGRNYLVPADAINSGKLESSGFSVSPSGGEYRMVDIDLRQLAPFSPGKSSKFDMDIDWDSYFSDSYHYIDYKRDLAGNTWSNAHTDPEVGKDSKLYSVTLLEFKDCQGSIVIGPGCTAEKHATGYIFSIAGNPDCAVFIPDVKAVSEGGETYYVISDTASLRILSGGRTADECYTVVSYSENFVNRAVEWGILRLVGPGVAYSSMEWGTGTQGEDPGRGFTVRDDGTRPDESGYHSTITVTSTVSKESIKMDGGCAAVSSGDGYVFTLGGLSLEMPSARLTSIDGRSLYMLSNSGTLEIRLTASTQEECRQKIDAAEVFLNLAIDSGALRQSLDPVSIRDIWEGVNAFDEKGWGVRSSSTYPGVSGYCSIVKVMCADSAVSLKIDGNCDAVGSGNGYVFTIDGLSLEIPGAYLTTIEGRSLFIISDSNTAEFQVCGVTEGECDRSRQAVVEFLWQAINAGVLRQTPDPVQAPADGGDIWEGVNAFDEDGWGMRSSRVYRDDSGYCAVVKVRCGFSEEQLKIDGSCDAVSSGEGYVFAINGSSLTIPYAYLTDIDGRSVYILSDSNVAEFQVRGSTMDECQQNISAAESSLWAAIEAGVLFQSTDI